MVSNAVCFLVDCDHCVSILGVVEKKRTTGEVCIICQKYNDSVFMMCRHKIVTLLLINSSYFPIICLKV